MSRFARRFLPRLSPGWMVLAALLLVLNWIAPQQVPVVLYKAVLVVMAGVCGYLLDRWVFPYARPHEYLNTATGHPRDGSIWLFLGACGRRMGIIAAAMLAVGLGL
ncbi:MAG: putative holin [Desulfovibrionaceae bacterium]